MKGQILVDISREYSIQLCWIQRHILLSEDYRIDNLDVNSPGLSFTSIPKASVQSLLENKGIGGVFQASNISHFGHLILCSVIMQMFNILKYLWQHMLCIFLTSFISSGIHFVKKKKAQNQPFASGLLVFTVWIEVLTPLTSALATIVEKKIPLNVRHIINMQGRLQKEGSMLGY